MYEWVSGWNWLWMGVMMVFWLIALGAVIYFAIRLAQRPPNSSGPRKVH
jgi:hypothetical protein